MTFDKRNISSFQRNVNINEGSFFWKKVIVDSVKYTESLLQLDRLKRTNYSSINGSDLVEEVSLDTMSYFSDNGSKIAFFNKLNNGTKSINIYSINLEQKTKTYLHNINITNTAFSAKSSENCFISNDGKYLLLSVPSASTVYFFDAVNGTLLQTITDEQVNFGSLIAIDSDFKGLAISTKYLRREPNEYDGRITANDCSSLIHFYKRNYKSKQPQKFKKIHSKTAFSPFVDNGCPFPQSFPFNILYDYTSLEPNAYQFNGVYRFSDIYCKNGNFSHCALALKEDQLAYKSRLFNYNSPRYSIKNSISINARQPEYLRVSNLYSPGTGFLQFIRIDSFYNNSTYKLINHPSCNIFNIIKTIDDTEIIDNSIYSSVPIGANMHISDITTIDLFGDQAYLDNFNKKHTVYDLTNFYSQESIFDFSAYEQLLYNEQLMIENKVCVNDFYVFNISVFLNNGIKNIRIHRYPIKSSDNLNTFAYFDHSYNGSGYSNLPDDPSVGLVKILYETGKTSDLENTFLTKQQIQNMFSDPSTGQVFVDSRVSYNKPFLQNPTQCVDSEFSFAISPSVLNQSFKNCLCSNDYLFLNFESNTLIFKIHSDVCKSIKYINQIDTIKDYDFCYTSTSEYFSMDDKIYKLNRTSGVIEESMVL